MILVEKQRTLMTLTCDRCGVTLRGNALYHMVMTAMGHKCNRRR